MASSLLTLQSFGSAFFTNHSLKSPRFRIPSILITPIGISQIPTFSSVKETHNLKLNPLFRASPEGVPSELIEDSKFVPLNPEDLRYGPPALLLLGFDLEETTKIQEFLKELDGEFVEIIHCTEDMITSSLWDAMNTEQQNLEQLKIAKSLPRICFLSGLTGEEMIMFIDAFPEIGIGTPVFAALVPNSADKVLQEVIEEVMGDHEMLNEKRSGST